MSGSGTVSEPFIDPLPNVPACLKSINNWVRWKLEAGDNGQLTKVPYRVDGEKAASTRPKDWTDYRTVCKKAVIDKTQGIGFAVTNGIVGIDLDNSYNADTDEVALWAQQIIETLSSYTEYTPSGCGLRVWVRGTLPEGDKVFNLDPAVGFGGSKATKIEVFAEARYFTVTGESYFEPAGDVEERDLSEVYQLFHEIRKQHPAPKREKAGSTEAGSSSSVQIVRVPGTLVADKLTVLMLGTVKSSVPFIIDYCGNTAEYPSHSEADLALATVLAIKHGDNAEVIDADFRKSPLYRDKWEREDYRNDTITKAIASAKKGTPDSQIVIPTQPVAAAAIAAAVPATDDLIPAFDRSVITGIYKDIVDVVCAGTTIPPQFAFLAAKVFIGARMAASVTFENTDADSSYYGVAIAETGTGKGLAWRRTIDETLQATASLNHNVKIINSADSGAGLKDVFFEPPVDSPIICYIDEVTTLGHKAGEKKNPEIVDTMIELADSHSISRVLAARNGQKANRTNNNARLSVYMCGQNGEVFMASFTGRTKLGIYDRLYPEYSPAIEAGDLPAVNREKALAIWEKLGLMKMSGHMTMTPETKAALDQFWASQLPETRKRTRLKKYLMLDTYMSAFGRGLMVAELCDLEAAIKMFVRQLAIRKVHFTVEVPDKVGLYVSKLKSITETMRHRLNAGEPIGAVALSLRDIQTLTRAYQDNEVQVFNVAWLNWKAQILPVKVVAKNGQTYDKFVPVPNEEETWANPVV